MSIHKPVLLKETIELLNLKKGDIVVDATLGGGGHAREVLKKIVSQGILIGIDADLNAIKNFAEFPISNFQFPNKSEVQNPKNFWKSKIGNLILVNDNFSDLKNILGGQGIETVDAVLADLGWSSDQIENAERGFSFQKNGRLDMRYGLRITNQYEYTNNNLTAAAIVNEYPEKELTRIIRDYGEEKFARSIARKIVIARKIKPIETTSDLVEIISSAVPERYKHGKINPATRTFQALRIETNHELENLKEFLLQAIEALRPGGRLAIVTFHSLEDRIVKNIFRVNAGGCICPPDFPKCLCNRKARIKIIIKKPVTPSDLEAKNNPRSRSAKLRVCEKL